MVKEFLHGLMGKNTWEITKMIKSKVRDNFYGQMVENITDNGKMGNSMEMECI